MKKLLFIFLLVISVPLMADHTIKIGSDGYVTIDGQNYKRGDLRSQYTYRAGDSLLAILYSDTRTYLITPTVDSNYRYADSSNVRCYNMLILRTWMNTNFEYKP